MEFNILSFKKKGKMNKKAQNMLKMPIYLIVSLVVGALVIIGFISIANRGLTMLQSRSRQKT